MTNDYGEEMTEVHLEEGRKYIAYQYNGQKFHFIAKEGPEMQTLEARSEYPYWPGPKYEFWETRYGGPSGMGMDGKWARVIMLRNEKEMTQSRKEFKKDYPLIYEIGAYADLEETGPPFVPRAVLHDALWKQGLNFKETYHKMFGDGQTCTLQGPYPWDVEAVLVRMKTGKLTGSQLEWD